MDVVYKEENYLITGALFEVYKEMGCGFLESVYQECLTIEFGLQKLPFRSQASLALHYQQRPLSQVYQPDFICFDKIVVEIKAVSSLSDVHRAQVHNYLRATGFRLRILANFNSHPHLDWERIVR